ncbi:acyltransferase family protein [Paenibacillus oleatilyticus]|uniref:Acyltransferase family protein n=1 Tax=Paenibacillus oleatilyticus TaxID=2594886 RepID=A0ABV4V3K9_9BACL
MNLQLYSTNKEFHNSAASAILDFLRFFAAFTVFLMHFRPFLEVPPEVKNTIYYQIFYSWASTGFVFVMVFFVLSGYFISSTVLNSILQGRWSWKTYLINRLSRLWVVLIPALLLTVLWAKLQINNFGNSQVMVNKISYFLTDLMSFKVLLGNVFFLQEIIVPTYGTNGPLWSLAFEFWYYILFPCIILIFKHPSKKKRFFYLIVSLIIILFIGRNIVLYFTIWLMGTIPIFLKSFDIHDRLKRILLSILTLALFITSLKLPYYWYNDFNPGYGRTDFAPIFVSGIGITISLYLIINLFRKLNFRRKLYLMVCKFLGGISYTLYLTHYPIFSFLRAWRFSKDWPVPLSYLYLFEFVAAIVILVYAILIAFITERNTNKIKKWIGNKFSF